LTAVASLGEVRMSPSVTSFVETIKNIVREEH